VLVEFYWVNPALGISAESVNLISQTVTAIGAKGSGNAHVMVKCPEAWVPTFVNGGHECLLGGCGTTLPTFPASRRSMRRGTATLLSGISTSTCLE